MISFMRNLRAFILGALCLFLCQGCGGSTSGTGGVTVDGEIVTKALTPLAGVSVTALQTGDQTISDSAGKFRLRTKVEGTLNLLFESSSLNARTALENIPTTAKTIAVTFEADESSNTVKARDVQISERRPGDSNADEEDSDEHDQDDDSEGQSDEDESDDDTDNDSSGPGNGESEDEEKEDDDNGDDDDSGPGNGGGDSNHDNEGPDSGEDDTDDKEDKDDEDEKDEDRGKEDPEDHDEDEHPEDED